MGAKCKDAGDGNRTGRGAAILGMAQPYRRHVPPGRFCYAGGLFPLRCYFQVRTYSVTASCQERGVSPVAVVKRWVSKTV